MSRHPFWRDDVFRLLGERMAVVLARFEEAKFVRLDTRLARHLLQRLGPGATTLTGTHQDLANELASAREVVSRTLSRWQKRGLVQVGRGALEVRQRPALERLGA